MKSVSTKAIFFFFCCVFLLSCEEEISNIRLTSRERIQIDTLAKHQIDSLVRVMDQLCIARYDSIRERALDSILTIRKEEEMKIRSRIQR